MKKFKKVLFLFSMLILAAYSGVFAAANPYKLLTHNDQEYISFNTETIRFKHDKSLNIDFIEVWVKHEFTAAGLKDYIEARKEAKFTYPGLENLNYFVEHQLYSPKHSYCLLDTTDYTKDNKILNRHTVTQVLWRDIDPESVGALMYSGILSYTMQNYDTLQKRSN